MQGTAVFLTPGRRGGKCEEYFINLQHANVCVCVTAQATNGIGILYTLSSVKQLNMTKSFKVFTHCDIVHICEDEEINESSNSDEKFWHAFIHTPPCGTYHRVTESGWAVFSSFHFVSLAGSPQRHLQHRHFIT